MNHFVLIIALSFTALVVVGSCYRDNDPNLPPESEVFVWASRGDGGPSKDAKVE